MYHKQRYKEILFIVDTCEGESLWDSVDVPNIYFVTSSIRDQKASSYSYDYKFMTPTVDRMHFKLNEYLERIYNERNFNIPINNIFQDFKTKERNFITSDIAIINRIGREIIFHEFFGNYLKQDNPIIKYDFNIPNKQSTPDFNINNKMINQRNKIEKEISNYNNINYKHIQINHQPNELDSNYVYYSISVLVIFYLLSIILIN
jgi:glycosylphosphatidylinositol transamidase (GPIT) subunit GPI8